MAEVLSVEAALAKKTEIQAQLKTCHSSQRQKLLLELAGVVVELGKAKRADTSHKSRRLKEAREDVDDLERRAAELKFTDVAIVEAAFKARKCLDDLQKAA